MSSLTNINNNSSVVNVGRTTPVSPGPQPASQSIPVVMASDQIPIPVIEQQKIQSEVALSMLGIPRSEVALGIFSDVNTYDVNPTEWSSSPEEYTPDEGWGIKHLPQEAGAMVQAPKDKLAVLSSKRFFRYQPGRVSSATFGVKSSKSPKPDLDNEVYDLNQAIRKYGIFDKFDGYYWETRGDAQGDNFAVVRRTQSLLNSIPVEFSNATTNQDDYRIVGKAASDPNADVNREPRAVEIIRDQFFAIIDAAYDDAVSFFTVGTASYLHLTSGTGPVKCKRDASFAMNAYILDLQYGGRGHTITNATTYRTAIGPTLVDNGTNDANAKRTAENKLHERLGIRLASALTDEQITSVNGVSVTARINGATTGLATITRAAVGLGATLGVQPSEADRFSSSSSIWARNKFKTVFSIYKKYLGYLISEAFIPDPNPGTYTDSIKYKCLRDVGYIVDGYGRDLAGGGNAATVYNMKNFYFNGVLQVVSEFAPSYTTIQFHIHAHTLLQTLISKNGNIASGDNPSATRWNIANLIGFTSVFNYFSLGETARTRFNNDLASRIITNFTTPYTGIMDFGTEAQFGDIITLRDGLIHIHAGVYDPSLLKETKRVRVRVVDDTLEVAEGEFVVDQIINFISDSGSSVANLTSNKLYAVKSVSGQLGNIITLYDPELSDAFDSAEDKLPITFGAITGTEHFIEPNVPFIFPNTYQKGTLRKVGSPSDTTATAWRKYDGMFPYMYASESGALDEVGDTKYTALPTNGLMTDLYTVGFINPAIDTSSVAYVTLREQIDYVNYKYNNWVKQNIDPKYYAVYEYRIPRSYFSTEKLDGETRNVIYSDVAIGDTGIKVRPGQVVLDDSQPVTKSSVWNIDLTKVTMLKIEFSWYGAVGALFLAYVPVSNDEARWVRVHHLRASNQLKISSLGNATLPITYVTYGGGSENKLGIPESINSYGTSSNHVVKYGASYYIDGGDRGTVRLYSHTNLVPADVYGRTYTLGTVTQSTDPDPTVGLYYITIPDATGPLDKTFFMKAQVATANNQDQGVQVIWVDNDQAEDERRLYLNKALVSTTSTGVKLFAKRPSVTFGLKAKQSIFNSEGTGIRNRVQVYPTKMSTANFADTPMTLDILKTPIFQPNISTDADGFELSAAYTITSTNESLGATTESLSYLENDGDFIYGWFIANVGTVFGKLYRLGGLYYFELKDVFTEEVRLFSGVPFLKDGRFSADPEAENITGEFEATTQKERLSSVFVSNVNQCPIPETGGIITSFFLSPGSDQFDLLSYFDYNKDYLSFPLTDEVNSIYLAASLSGESTTTNQINTSITWEEQ
jgi:hypothetical protein